MKEKLRNHSSEYIASLTFAARLPSVIVASTVRTTPLCVRNTLTANLDSLTTSQIDPQRHEMKRGILIINSKAFVPAKPALRKALQIDSLSSRTKRTSPRRQLRKCGHHGMEHNPWQIMPSQRWNQPTDGSAAGKRYR